MVNPFKSLKQLPLSNLTTSAYFQLETPFIFFVLFSFYSTIRTPIQQVINNIDNQKYIYIYIYIYLKKEKGGKEKPAVMSILSQLP